MNIKQVVIVGTMAFVITLTPGISAQLNSGSASACPIKQSNLHNDNTSESENDDFNEALGVSADETVYNALLEGNSLADIADSHQQDVDRLIELQVSQMQGQLTQRYRQGNLSPESYSEQMKELPDIIKESVYKRYTI
ncbi:hypothetical protein FHR92_000145 [Fontibacillus solani]|uniref:Uncharacterized protein n=1 Tax=Fontibacillus solani TaxID=1572857 RepID=A0A7W3XPN0_9BACL|nr:hypothetical protein [Fontibacillus solani]MBA9083702.1 hypothetical protein [Fontibacillus solani]